MSVKLGDATRNNQADALADLYDGGEIKIYSGSQPATADTAPTGTLLATIALPTPAFGSASGGVASKSGTWSAVAVASATAGYFRMKTSGGLKPVDGSVTGIGGGGQLELDDVSITSGQTVNISSFTITQPAS